jgi:hypothetical protein
MAPLSPQMLKVKRLSTLDGHKTFHKSSPKYQSRPNMYSDDDSRDSTHKSSVKAAPNENNDDLHPN